MLVFSIGQIPEPVLECVRKYFFNNLLGVLVSIHLALNLLGVFILCLREIVHLLQIQPKLRAIAKETAKTQSRIRCHRTFAMHNVPNAGRGHTDLHRQLMLAQAKRLQEFVPQNNPGMGRSSLKIPPFGRPDVGRGFPSSLDGL